MAVASWTCEQVVQWLHDSGFGSFKETFSENEISGDVLPTLTNEILRDDLKISAYGHRVKLLRAIHELLAKSTSPDHSRPPHQMSTEAHVAMPSGRIISQNQEQGTNPPEATITSPKPAPTRPPPRVLVLPPRDLPEIPKVGRRRFFNTKVGRDIRLHPTYPHAVVFAAKGSCVMCFSDSTSGRRRELSTTKKCLTCQVHLCTKKFGDFTTSCFDAFHQEETLEMRSRPPPRPRVTYILPNWDPTKDSYESLKRQVLARQLQHK